MPPMSKKPIKRRQCQSTLKPETRYCAVSDDVSGKTVTRTLLSILISHLLLMGLPAALTSNAHAENRAALSATTKERDMNLYRELVANERPTGHVAPVITGTGSTGSIHVIWLLQGFHLLPGNIS